MLVPMLTCARVCVCRRLLWRLRSTGKSAWTRAVRWPVCLGVWWTHSSCRETVKAVAGKPANGIKPILKGRRVDRVRSRSESRGKGHLLQVSPSTYPQRHMPCPPTPIPIPAGRQGRPNGKHRAAEHARTHGLRTLRGSSRWATPARCQRSNPFLVEEPRRVGGKGETW